MANFRTHFVAAAALSGAASCALLAAGALQPSLAVLGFALGTSGGLLPDIDAERSTPVQLAFTAAALVFAFVITFGMGGHYSVAEMLVLWAAAFAAVRLGLLWFFQSFTVHRGMIHSVPAALIAGVLVVNGLSVLFGFAPHEAWLMGGFVSGGYLIHLALDEWVSVNLFGRRLKRSLGSAFKLYQRGNWGASILAWCLLAVVLSQAPDPIAAWRSLAPSELAVQLAARWWPRDGRWFDDWW